MRASVQDSLSSLTFEHDFELFEKATTLAGAWKSMPNQVGTAWPFESWHRDEDGSWPLHGRHVSMNKSFAQSATARLKINASMSKMQSQLHEELPMNEFLLDGRETSYVPLHCPGTAKFRCISCKPTQIIAESHFPNGLAYRWTLQLLKSRLLCELQIENMETGAVGLHFFRRECITNFPSKVRLRKIADQKRQESMMVAGTPKPEKNLQVQVAQISCFTVLTRKLRKRRTLMTFRDLRSGKLICIQEE